MCARLADIDFVDALWTRRLDIWTSDPATQEKIRNRLGWLHAMDAVTPQLPRMHALADAIRAEGLTDVVLLGMGGSSLAPEVLRQIVGVAPGFPRFRMLDSVDPDAVRSAFDRPGTSLFVLASKSGSTIEPNVMAAEARRRLEAAGIAQSGSRFIAITDEGTALHKRAQAEGFREIFVNPSDIGGRYSALSLFGMVPAALMGADVERLLAGAREMETACRARNISGNPGCVLGAFMAAAADAGRDKLTLLLTERPASFGLWVEQLVAESTGKQGKGIVPLTGERLTGISFDRALVSCAFGSQRPNLPTDAAHDTRTPLFELEIPDEYAIGAEFLRWEIATATAGLLLGINPFDEPNVQQAKDATNELLKEYKATQRFGVQRKPYMDIEGAWLMPSEAAEEALLNDGVENFLNLVRDGDYLGLLAYLPPDSEPFDSALRNIRTSLGSGSAPTMFGYGPRYLHSTGQLHKGGANNGVFIIVTADADEDLPIPGEPFSFGVLETAQALGDFTSLDKTGRRALLVHLERRDVNLLKRVFDRLLKI